jgi:hypothetical protein
MGSGAVPTTSTHGGLEAKPRSIPWPGIRIVAAHGRVIPVGVLRAIPGRVVARVTVAETITKVITKKNTANTEYGAASESAESPIEVPTWKMPIAEAHACEPVPSGEVVATTSAACVSACGNGGLRNPDGKRGGNGKIP